MKIFTVSEWIRFPAYAKDAEDPRGGDDRTRNVRVLGLSQIAMTESGMPRHSCCRRNGTTFRVGRSGHGKGNDSASHVN